LYFGEIKLVQKESFGVCEPDECDTFQFMSNTLGMKVLHPGGQQATKLMAEKCGISKDMTILDVGCGRGSSSIFLAEHYGCRVVGVDVDPNILMKAHERARKRNVLDRVAFRIADIHSLPLQEKMFDGAIFQASLIFCDKTRALQAVKQTIHSGGFLGAVELAWKVQPTTEIVAKVKSVLCAAAVNAENHQDWMKVFERAGFDIVSGDIHDLDFTFRDMLRNEGLLSTSRIAFKCLFNKAARQKTEAITNLFKETDSYLGYGIYVCRKPTR
jgi:ubiquinone/menaquinone biosynthesis C-methylase UbiE